MAHVSHARKVRRRELKAEQQRQRRINLFGRVPDKLWAVFVKYLPSAPAPDRRGRPVIPFRSPGRHRLPSAHRLSVESHPGRVWVGQYLPSPVSDLADSGNL